MKQPLLRLSLCLLFLLPALQSYAQWMVDEDFDTVAWKPDHNLPIESAADKVAGYALYHDSLHSPIINSLAEWDALKWRPNLKPEIEDRFETHSLIIAQASHGCRSSAFAGLFVFRHTQEPDSFFVALHGGAMGARCLSHSLLVFWVPKEVGQGKLRIEQLVDERWY